MYCCSDIDQEAVNISQKILPQKKTLQGATWFFFVGWPDKHVHGTHNVQIYILSLYSCPSVLQSVHPGSITAGSYLIM